MRGIYTTTKCTCGKTLFKGFLFVGEIEIKCRYCKRIEHIVGISGSLSDDYRHIFVTDITGKILSASSVALNTTQFSLAELLSKNISEILHPLSKSHLEKFHSDLRGKSLKSFVFKVYEVLKSGDKISVQAGVRLFKSITGADMFMFDINTKKPLTPRPLKPIKDNPKSTGK